MWATAKQVWQVGSDFPDGLTMVMFTRTDLRGEMAHSPERPAATDDGTPTISASSFKATCLELIDDIARTAGEMIVTKHGRPVVRVSAIHASTESPWGFMRGSVVQHGDIVSPDSELWAVSLTEPLAVRRRG